MHQQPTIINDCTINTEESLARPGPRTPPTPTDKPKNVRQRTGPRTPSPQPSKDSFERSRNNGERQTHFASEQRFGRRRYTYLCEFSNLLIRMIKKPLLSNLKYIERYLYFQSQRLHA